MATTFHYFSRLPPEIRIAIWKFCLPNRVTELVYPDNSDYCQLRHASSLNSKPPIISRVCHESRQVAFGEGGFLGDLYARGDEGWDAFHSRNFDRRLWITPTTGTLHLNLAKETEIGHESNIKNFIECYLSRGKNQDCIYCVESDSHISEMRHMAHRIYG